MVSYIVRFTARSRGTHTHLTRVHGALRVGLSRSGTFADIVPVEDAAKFASHEAAMLGLAEFIIGRGGWSEKDWISKPEILTYEDKPVLLARTVTDTTVFVLTKEGDEYVVSGGLNPLRYRDRPDAIEVFLKAVAEALA